MAITYANLWEEKNLVVNIRKEFNSHRISLEHQYGRRFIVLEHPQADLAMQQNGNVSWQRRGQIKQLAWPMAERQIGHRKPSLVLSGRFPVVKWRVPVLLLNQPNLAAVTSSETFDRFIPLSNLQENINNNHHNTTELPSLQQCIT